MGYYTKEVRGACEDAIRFYEMGERDRAIVALHVPWFPSGERLRLLKRSGPYCEYIACCPSIGGTTAYWDARKVLKFLDKIEGASGVAL